MLPQLSRFSRLIPVTFLRQGIRWRIHKWTHRERHYLVGSSAEEMVSSHGRPVCVVVKSPMAQSAIEQQRNLGPQSLRGNGLSLLQGGTPPGQVRHRSLELKTHTRLAFSGLRLVCNRCGNNGGDC